MKAVILAAGEGARMRPLTYTRPKVMLPLANKPIMERTLLEAIRAGITEFIIIVGYHEEQVRDYFSNGKRWGVSIDYYSQRQQLGTAEALQMANSQIDEKFLVINADILTTSQDIAVIMTSEKTTLGVIEVGDVRGLGTVEIDGDRVVRIHEKADNPPSHMVNAGVYLFTPEIYRAISRTPKSPRGEYEITDSLQILIDDGQQVGYQEIGYWLNLSYPWDLLSANEYLLDSMEPQNLGQVEDNVVIKGKVSIGSGTLLRSGSYIIGPVIIGKGCDIGPNCYIRAHTSIGDNCHIGSAVEVKNSIIMNGSKIPHQNYVGDSVIGEQCNFGAGTKIANLRLDKKDVIVAGTNTRRRKLGAIVGDRVETGVNACINVGSLIGNNTHIGLGAVASGVILPDSRIL
ncbi:bifunctional sugar-1-phosphate nucleotidylyltransferase/acetyltransferase [Chloroflexota bacterium]